MIAAATPAVGRSQSAYYQDRYQDLERASLNAVAARIAVAFAGQPGLRRTALNEAIADALPEGQSGDAEVLQCCDNLADLGYVWNPPDADDLWQPGVPSLMDCVCRHA
ncbi:MAG: hypothetical protein OXP11_15195 [Gammaproteobacteria bacterium]|nr:hypothetical protein [Gammaproteobacteria bacterium]